MTERSPREGVNAATPRATATDRLRRLLAMIPWLAGRDGPTVEEVLARFGLTRRQLDEDLDLLMVVGVPPYTPDELFEMTIEDGRVFARLTPSFDRPLRLSPDEALAVVVAGRAVADVPGADPRARWRGRSPRWLGYSASRATTCSTSTSARWPSPPSPLSSRRSATGAGW